MARPDSPPLLAAQALRKTFFSPSHVDVLKGIDLFLFEGQSVAIMGASGEGKSTLLQILGTLETASGGDLFIQGQKVTPRNAPHFRNHAIGFVFQGFHLLDDYSVLQNVLMPALIAGQDISNRSVHYRNAWDLLERVGLSNRALFSTKLLSGGEKQRVAIARALCNDPSILLADEPSGNLDAANSEKIHSLLLQCVKEFKKGLIVVTHNPALAALCDACYRLKGGILHLESVKDPRLN